MSNPVYTLRVTIAGPATAKVGEPIMFSAAVVDGAAPFEIAWRFGDGVTGLGRDTSHVYTTDDVFMVTVAVRDKQGQRAEASHFISILIPEPLEKL